MRSILEEIIDYSLTPFELFEQLKDLNILILRKSPLYIVVAVPHNISHDLQWLKEYFKLPIKTFVYKAKEIEYIYNDFILKEQLFSLVKLLFEEQQYASNKINEFFEALVQYAVEKKSSDIHIETVEDGLIIRLRIDGSLVQIIKFGFGLYPVVSAVIKVIAQLDISKKRVSQNGRFTKKINDISYDFRVSIMPINNGESIVVRILNTQYTSNDLNQLGMNQKTVEILKKGIQKNQGLLLVTGPTGSGKTTTMYALLQQLNFHQKKIITLEDPVEYQIDYAMQINIDEAVGFSYAKVLKDVLRQDPDVIMIGEIRDQETLQIALQAALTGHLVLATIHTNDSLSTIERLMDLQALPFLIASTLNIIVSQRLVRKICSKCNNNGCKECNLSGFDGREIVSETLIVDSTIASYIKNGFQKEKIKTYLQEKKFQTMYEDGLEKIKNNITTIEELKSVCQSNDETI